VIRFTLGADLPMNTLDEWEQKLEGFDATVARIPGRGIDLTLFAPGDLSMFDAINKIVSEVAHVVQMPEPVGLEVLTELEWERLANAPSMPELMSAAEIADELQVSRQRVHQLRKTPGFPSPLADLRGGAVWDAAAVRKFDREWKRVPGRPRTSTKDDYPE
jgi:hypothetical protein